MGYDLDIGSAMLTPCGKTHEGLFVLSGCFHLTGTHGFPVDMLYDHLKANGYIINWWDWYQDARKDGWAHRTIVARVAPLLPSEYEAVLNAFEFLPGKA